MAQLWPALLFLAIAQLGQTVLSSLSSGRLSLYWSKKSVETSSFDVVLQVACRSFMSAVFQSIICRHNYYCDVAECAFLIPANVWPMCSCSTALLLALSLPVDEP